MAGKGKSLKRPDHQRTKLFRVRVDRGLTLRQLSGLVDIPIARLSEYERDLAEPRISIALHIAAQLNMTVESIFGR